MSDVNNNYCYQQRSIHPTKVLGHHNPTVGVVGIRIEKRCIAEMHATTASSHKRALIIARGTMHTNTALCCPGTLQTMYFDQN